MTLASLQSAEWVQIRTDDGRVLESYVAGNEDSFPLLFISGTPSAATPHARTLALAAERKLRLQLGHVQQLIAMMTKNNIISVMPADITHREPNRV